MLGLAWTYVGLCWPMLDARWDYVGVIWASEGSQELIPSGIWPPGGLGSRVFVYMCMWAHGLMGRSPEGKFAYVELMLA